MIVDPTVPLHSLLPKDDIRADVGPAFILGSEDFMGFNSGNMVYRCGMELAGFLSHMIALSDDMTKIYRQAESQGPDGTRGVELSPSDQRSMCLILEKFPAYSSRFYHYPQGWLNAYGIHEERVDVQLHTHLVAYSKFRDEYDEYTAEWESGWARLNNMTRLEVEQRVIDVEKKAEDWWETAKIGHPRCNLI